MLSQNAILSQRRGAFSTGDCSRPIIGCRTETVIALSVQKPILPDTIHSKCAVQLPNVQSPCTKVDIYTGPCAMQEMKHNLASPTIVVGKDIA